MSPAPVPTDWAAVRVAYLTSSEAVLAICKRFEITYHDLTKRRLAEKWKPRVCGPEVLKLNGIKRRTEALGAVLDDADASTDPPAPAPDIKTGVRNTATGSMSHRRALIRRLFTALDLKLTELERRIAASAAAGKVTTTAGAESERDTRMLTHALKTYEQLCDVADAQLKAQTTAHANAETSDDVDHLRTDLRDRIERLRVFAHGTADGRQPPRQPDAA